MLRVVELSVAQLLTFFALTSYIASTEFTPIFMLPTGLALLRAMITAGLPERAVDTDAIKEDASPSTSAEAM
jgi:hypothetical protein